VSDAVNIERGATWRERAGLSILGPEGRRVMTDWPWEFNAGSGRKLIIGPTGGEGRCYLRVESGDDADGPSACLDGLDLPEIMVKACEAAGTAPPVMLGRPDVNAMRDARGWVSFRGVQLRESRDGGVSLGIGGNLETLSSAQARQMAAVAVAMADKPPEPDPAEVGEIAALIYQTMYPGYAPEPGERAREAARAVLLRMRGREADRG
jgi:hypothetical protein